MFLNDQTYENENGAYLDRNEIETLGTYEYVVDGFFNWQCGGCGKVHKSRAFKVGGVIFKCAACDKKNLLVRTDIRFINQKMANADRNETASEDRISHALGFLGQGIAALGKR